MTNRKGSGVKVKSGPPVLDHVVDDLTCRDCSGHPYGVGLYTRVVHSTAGVVSTQYKYECMGAGCCRGTAFTNTEAKARAVFVTTCEER